MRKPETYQIVPKGLYGYRYETFEERQKRISRSKGSRKKSRGNLSASRTQPHHVTEYGMQFADPDWQPRKKDN